MTPNMRWLILVGAGAGAGGRGVLAVLVKGVGHFCLKVSKRSEGW